MIAHSFLLVNAYILKKITMKSMKDMKEGKKLS